MLILLATHARTGVAAQTGIHPNKACVEIDLLQTYFGIFHPSYPVEDGEDFFRRREERRLTLLVLHAVFFLAATHCDVRFV